MQPEPQAGNSVEPQKRPWYRLHLSTWLMLVPVAVLLVIVMVPCALIGRRGHSDVPKCVHGWPWAYAEQDQFRQLLFGSVLRMTDADPNAELPPLWLKENAWRLSEASWLNGWNLVFDLLVACAVLLRIRDAGGMASAEADAFFPVHASRGAGAMFVTAVLCSAWKTARQQYLAERDALRQLSRIAGARAAQRRSSPRHRWCGCLASELRMIGGAFAESTSNVLSERHYRRTTWRPWEHFLVFARSCSANVVFPHCGN